MLIRWFLFYFIFSANILVNYFIILLLLFVISSRIYIFYNRYKTFNLYLFVNFILFGIIIVFEFEGNSIYCMEEDKKLLKYLKTQDELNR